MAERSFIYCPFCERQNNLQTELLRGNPELHLYKCSLGHSFDYHTLMGMSPTMIKLEHIEKPRPTDVKAEFFVAPDLWGKFLAKFPNRKNATMESIMALSLDDDLIIISGEQAKKLKGFGIKTGQEMLACAENNQTLTAENEQLVRDNNRFYAAVGSAMATTEA